MDKAYAQVVALLAIGGTMLGWLPAIAAAIAATFYIIEIWESPTVQHWFGRSSAVEQAAKKLLDDADLQAQVIRGRAVLAANQLEQDSKASD